MEALLVNRRQTKQAVGEAAQRIASEDLRTFDGLWAWFFAASRQRRGCFAFPVFRRTLPSDFVFEPGYKPPPRR